MFIGYLKARLQILMFRRKYGLFFLLFCSLMYNVNCDVTIIPQPKFYTVIPE